MKIQVNKDRVQIIENDRIESGEYNITECEFEFTEEYESLVKVAVFTNSYGSYKVDIVENKCNIASEVLEKADTIKIGVYAYKVDNEELQLRYSPTPTYFKVKEGSYVKNSNNSEEPTPSEVEQIESRIQQNADNIDALDEVVSGLHNYDDTEIKNNIATLEDKVDNLHNYDDTEIKQDISEIKQKNTEQDTSIQNLQTNKADKTEIPTDLSELNDDTTHRVVTDVEKASWNNKSEFSGSYDDLTDKPSIPTKTSDITNNSGFIDKEVNNLTNYELKTNTGSSIALSINSSTYVMTVQLKNSNNEVLSEGTIDLPLETMVVNATYDNNTKEIVLTLQSGTTTRFSVADLVSGLVSTTDLNTILASYYTKTEIDNLLGNKVDKVAGKSLISDIEIERLANVDNYDDSEVKQDISDIKDEQTEQNERIEVLETELAETQTKLDRTRASLPKVSGEGEYVTLDGTSEDEFIEPPLPMGVTKQDTTKMTYKCDGTETGTYYLTYNSINYQFTMPEVTEGDILVFDTTSLVLSLNDTNVTTTTGTEGTQITFSASPNPDYPQEIKNVSGDVNVTVANSDNTKSQTFTFPLSTGQKLMEGDYLADDGVHHVRYSLVLNGTENWRLYNTSSGLNQITLRVTEPPKYESSSAKASDLYCSHFTSVNYTKYWSKENSIIFAMDDTLSIQTTMSLNEFKTFLSQQYESETPVTIEYELETEIIEPYTETQQTAYNNIKEALSYKDQTNIYSTNEVSPTFKVKAYADVSSEIDNLKTAIVALGGVV